MNLKNLTLAVLVFSSAGLMAGNHMVVIGGGGDPAGPTTIFDENLKAVGQLLQKNQNWKYQLSFNGGHSNTEDILLMEFRNPVKRTTNFTGETYKNTIAEYKNKILSGEIKSGDQLMIVVDTHGAAKLKNEKTHLVSVTGGGSATVDLNNLTGAKVVNLDDLEEIVKLTNDKGIKLAVVDMSCHSGNTLAFKKNAPNTCIISSTSPNHYGYGGRTSFPGKFWDNLKPGTNLEEAFLKARLDSLDGGYPMISTKENDEIIKEAYNPITPYFYYANGNADKLTPYLLQSSTDQIICQRDEQFKSLIDKIDELQAAATGKKDGYNGEELKRLLISYKETQDGILKKLNALGGSYVDINETFSGPITYKGKAKDPFILNMTFKQMATSDPDGSIAYFENSLKTTKDPIEKAERAGVIVAWKKMKARREEILKQYPSIANFDVESKKIVKEIGLNRKTADTIALQEKKFYDELYRKKQSNENDACRSFVF